MNAYAIEGALKRAVRFIDDPAGNAVRSCDDCALFLRIPVVVKKSDT